MESLRLMESYENQQSGKSTTQGETLHSVNDGTWEVHENLDMCGQGDVKILGNWKSSHSIDDLKRMLIDLKCSAFTVSNGNPSFGHAAFKKFNY